MNIIDIIVLIVLAVGLWQGWRDGLVKSLCSFAGFFLGLLVAYTFYAVVGEKLAPHLGDKAQAAPIVAFILIWLAVPIALNFVGIILTKFLSAMMLGGANKLTGSFIGMVKYFLGATLVLYVLVMMNFISLDMVDNSLFGTPMLEFADWVMASFRDSNAADAINQLPQAA